MQVDLERESRPGEKAASQESLAGDISILPQIRRRHLASLRCEPLDSGRHDPAYPERGRPSEPSDYGLTVDELLYEAARLRWQPWELRARLVDPQAVAS